LLGAIIVGVLGVQASNLVAPLFMRTFFNMLASGLPASVPVYSLLVILGFVGIAWVFSWAAQLLQDTAGSYLQSRVRSTLPMDAFAYLIDHSYNFFTSNFAGSLTTKVGRYARAYEQLFNTVVTQLVPTALFVFGAVIVLFLRNHMLGGILALWSIAFVVLQVWLANFRQPLRNARATADTRMTATLADAISNQSTISLFSATTYEQKRFGDAVIHWRDIVWRLWSFDSLMAGIVGLFTIGIELVLLYGAVHYWHEGLLTIGDFILIQSYLLTTINQLNGINYQIRNFYDALTDAGEMVAIMKTEHEIKDVENAPELAVSAGTILFDDVNFGFQKVEKGVLTNFNLLIPGSQKVALVGPSGAGKSTITKLLLRFFDVKSGSIQIDGQNIAKVTQASLRNAIAFVPQEPILFHRSLLDNIRYGRRDASEEEVIAAAKEAHCHEFISRLPEGYQTFVGERGIKLSGGERQRVAIARAILKNAPILVLDEATSSLDSESEALIQDALQTLMQGKTVIVIAHRLSTIMKMDRIIVLENGVIVADGTHLELVRQPGLYQKLWSIQAGGFIGGAEEDTEKVVSAESTFDEPLVEESDELAEGGKEE
jgi:ATP-binding cassette subfamily B protein